MYNIICTSHAHCAKCTNQANVQKLLYIFSESHSYSVYMYRKWLHFLVHVQKNMYISKYLMQHQKNQDVVRK